jgi:hypothetical protein
VYESQPLETFFENTTSKPLMKSKALVCVIIVIVIVGYILSPYISINGLFSSIRSGDIYALKKHIRFVELKSSLKDEIKSKLLKELDKSIKGDPASTIGTGLAALLAPALVDDAVDAIVTPSGLSAFISNPENAMSSTLDKDVSKKANPSTSFHWKNVEYAFFTSLTEFEVRTDSDITLQFSLSGLSWKLDGIILPNKATRKKRLASMNKGQIIIGCWLSPNNNTSFCLNKDGTGNFIGNNCTYSFTNEIIYWDIIKNNGDHMKVEWKVCEADDENMIVVSGDKGTSFTLQKISSAEMKRIQLGLEEIHKNNERDYICGMAENLIERIDLAFRYSNDQSIAELKYPVEMNIKSKAEYLKALQQAINNGILPKDYPDVLNSIFKYFDIANISFFDPGTTVFFITKKTDDGLFSNYPKKITRTGLTTYLNDTQFNLPSREPAILPEN